MAQREFLVPGATTVVADGEVLAIPAAKQRALLAYLLIHRGEVIPPERLLDALWGETAPASGVKTLQYHLSKLRQRLGPCGDLIVFRDSGYVLDVSGDHLDSERFERLGRFAEARPLWDEALARARQVGDAHLAITQLVGIAVNEFHIGDERAALAIALDALDEALSIHNVPLTTWVLEVVASLATPRAPLVALSLATAVAEQQRAIGGGMPVGPLDMEDAAAAARAMISAEDADRATELGEQMDLSRACAHARECLRDRVDVGD